MQHDCAKKESKLREERESKAGCVAGKQRNALLLEESGVRKTKKSNIAGKGDGLKRATVTDRTVFREEEEEADAVCRVFKFGLFFPTKQCKAKREKKKGWSQLLYDVGLVFCTSCNPNL